MKEEIMKLREGYNRVYFVSSPTKHKYHNFKDPITNVHHCVEGCNINCSYCKNYGPPYIRFSSVVIDRYDNKEKVLWYHTHLFNKIEKAFAEVGTTYCDLIIMKKKRGFTFITFEVTGVLATQLIEPAGVLKEENSNNPDMCSCGFVGIRDGMACICPKCNNIIWGC